MRHSKTGRSSRTAVLAGFAITATPLALAIIIAVIILAQFKGNQGEQGGNRSTVTQTETPPPQTSESAPEPAPAHPSGWTTGHPEQGSTLLLATAVPLLHPGTDEIAT